MTDQAPPRPTPIYVSYLTFTNLLDWLRDLGTLPSQFDRSFWGHKFSGSGGGQLMAGLRFLGLLEGDAPTDSLERLALASNEDRRGFLLEVLKDKYGAEFIASLPRTTPRLVNERLAELGTTDATAAKARSFFVNAAKSVGLQLPPQVAKQARNKPAVTRNKAVITRKPSLKLGEEGAGPETDASPRRDILKKGAPPAEIVAPEGLHDALVPLLRDLAKDGPTWTDRGRARWKKTWDQTLDYAYPVEGEGQEGN